MIEHSRTGNSPRQTRGNILVFVIIVFHSKWAGRGVNVGGKDFLLVFLAGDGQYSDASVSTSFRTHTRTHIGSTQPHTFSPSGLSRWHHAGSRFLYTLMHFCLYVWCQHIMLHHVCSYIQSIVYVFSAVLYIQTSLCVIHAWMHKVYIFFVVGIYSGCVQRKCSDRGRQEVSVHCICLQGWVWTGRVSFRMHMKGWRVETFGHWSGGFLVVLDVSDPESECQHTLLWVNILTRGESHPLPAEHWPTDGAVGGNKQRKKKHRNMRLAKVNEWKSRETNLRSLYILIDTYTTSLWQFSWFKLFSYMIQKTA